jgi:hypothetical protein
MAVMGKAERAGRIRAIGLSLLLSVSVAGCGGYDVELNGGIFQAIGVAGVVGQGKNKEEKLAARPGIVVPPSTASLPTPGSAPQPDGADQAWPVNPEDRVASEKKMAQAQHEAFCAEQRRKHESGLIPVMADGPLGSCHQSILKNFAPHLYANEGKKPDDQ